jgi:O-antigen/teichoic acid export membrane protein
LLAVLWLTHSIPEAVLAMAAASWCAVLFHDRSAARICGSMSRRTSLANPRRLILQSLPVGASLCFSTLAFNIPVVMIRYFQGDAAVGSFYPLIHMQSAGIVIVSAMSQPVSHELAASYAANALWRFFRLLNRLLLRTLGLGVLICLVAIVAGHWLFGCIAPG